MNMHVNPGASKPATRQPKPSVSGSRQRRNAASPQAIAQMALDRAKGDKEAAINSLIEAAASNATLRVFLVGKGARAAIGELVRTDNARIFTGNPTADVTRARMVEPPLVGSAHRERLMRTAKTLSLLSITLPNGVLLANAKRSDVQSAIDHYEPQARDMLHKAEFYKHVLQRLPTDKTVAEVMDDKSLTSLYEATRPN